MSARALAGRPAAAFTLLEVLLAVAIFSVVLTAIHLVFHTSLRLQSRTTAKVEVALPIQHALAVMRRDLQNLTAPGGTLAAGLVDSTSVMASNSTALYGAEFYTTTGRLTEADPWGEIQRVSYHLEDSTNRTVAGRDLFRAVTRNLLPTFEEEPEEEWLMSGVEQLRVLFFDGTDWLDTWDATLYTNTLPGAVKVEIQLAQATTEVNAVEPAPIELVVPVEIQARTTQTSTNDTTGGGQ